MGLNCCTMCYELKVKYKMWFNWQMVLFVYDLVLFFLISHHNKVVSLVLINTNLGCCYVWPFYPVYTRRKNDLGLFQAWIEEGDDGVCRCMFLNVFMFVLFCVLGNIKPTHYQRECSCSQLTPLSSLFTGVSEGRKPDQASVLLCSPRKWTYCMMDGAARGWKRARRECV